MIAILILAQSREGYIGLALTIIVLALIALSPKGRLYSLAGMLIIAIILGILLASHWNSVQSWALGSDLPAGSALSLDTLQVRMEIWSRAIYGIQDFPFTGMGMNVFRKAVSVLYPLFTIPPGRDIGHAHNEFLQAALDLGIPGLIAFIGLYIVAFWMLLSTWRRVRAGERSLSPSFPIADASAKSVGRFSLLDASPFANTDFVKIELLGLGGGLLAHMIWGMTDTIALGARPGFLFWIILGLICGLHQQAQERAETIESIASSKSMDVGLHV